jgi:hypothetical protein
MKSKGWSLVAFLPRLCLTTIISTFVAAGANAQDLQLVASPNPAPVYQKVTLSVVVPASNPETVSAQFPERSNSFHIVSGPYVQPFVDSSSSGNRSVKVSYVVEGNETGRIIIPPLSVAAGGSSYATKPLVLAFGVLRNGEVVVPLHPVWTILDRRPDGVFYTGEAIPVILELRNEAERTTIDSIHIADPLPGLEEVKELAAPTETVVGDTRLYQIPVESFILTANAAGTISLPAVSVTAGNRSGLSSPMAIRISQTPDVIAESGAIGTFSFRSWTTTRSVTGGEEVSLHLRIEGSGNLSRITLPVPSSTGLLDIGKQETQHMSAGISGYFGFREMVYQYLLQPSTESGGSAVSKSTGSITVPSFRWLDPRNGTQTAPARVFALAPAVGGTPAAGDSSVYGSFSTSPGTGNIPKTEAANVKRSTVQLPFQLEPAGVVRGSEYRELYTNGNTYLWLIPGPIVFGLFLLVRPRRKGGGSLLGAGALFLVLLACRIPPSQDSLQSGVEAYAAGNYEQAARDLAAARPDYPRNAALSYDIGLVEYRLGRYGEAVHSVRTAVYYSPLSQTYRSALDWMVGEIGVTEQVPAAYPIHPDLFLFVLIIGINAAAILGIGVMVRRSGAIAIALILVLVISVIAGGGLGYTAVKRSVETAVVKSAGTEMTKIPMAVAGHWLELPAGMAVRIRDEVKDYYLVETAYGNTGWVRQDRVLVDGR